MSLLYFEGSVGTLVITLHTYSSNHEPAKNSVSEWTHSEASLIHDSKINGVDGHMFDKHM